MSYFLDDDASQIRELKDKLDKLQSDFLSTQFSVTQENQDSSQSTFPGANPSARGGSGGSGGGSASEPYPTTLQTPASASGVLTIDLNFHTHTITVTEDITSILFSNIPVAGQSRQFTILFKQDGTANTWDITFPASMGGAVISLAEDQRARYVFHTEDAGVTYEIDSLLGPRIFATDVSNWSQFPALQDIDFSTFDGINIDRLLLDQAAGSSIAAGDTGFTSDAAKNIISHVPTGASNIIQVDGVNIVTVNATSVLAPDILPSGVDDIGSTLLPWNDVISNQLSLQAVAAPGAPNNGELWLDTADSKIYARSNGVTKEVGADSEVTLWTTDHDANGNTLILDADGDSSISSVSDDSIQIVTGGASELSITNGFVTVPNSLIVNGNTTFGNASSDIITTNARFATALVPDTDITRDLGINTTNRWRDLWLGRDASILGTMIVGGGHFSVRKRTAWIFIQQYNIF